MPLLVFEALLFIPGMAFGSVPGEVWAMFRGMLGSLSVAMAAVLILSECLTGFSGPGKFVISLLTLEAFCAAVGFARHGNDAKLIGHLVFAGAGLFLISVAFAITARMLRERYSFRRFCLCFTCLNFGLALLALTPCMVFFLWQISSLVSDGLFSLLLRMTFMMALLAAFLPLVSAPYLLLIRFNCLYRHRLDLLMGQAEDNHPGEDSGERDATADDS